ncbi:Tfp pilus assembly protein FimT/FimU [Xanthobacter sp. AM11]|uniref:Tfp pilus assembly protein FimT/FimU n=1 Tax=Xanthobacter sp. AM11 TaxID=3380643 RepID=UPI0039BFA5B3
MTGGRAPDGQGEGREPGEAGFTLLEIVCALAIVAAIAGLALPRLAPGTSRPRLEAYAVEAASIFKADRTAALRRGVPVSTTVDTATRRIASGAGRRVVRLPADVRMEAVLPRACNGVPVRAAVSFLPSGMSCGGTVAVLRGGQGYEVRVNWLTGGVEIVPRGQS